MKIRTKILWFAFSIALAGAPACKEEPKGPAVTHLKAGDEALGQKGDKQFNGAFAAGRDGAGKSGNHRNTHQSAP